MLDRVATDLAMWLDQESTRIAAALAPAGVAPFSAQLSETQKLDYYKNQLFNPDGTPNLDGRQQQMQRLGPEGFTQVYKAVMKAYPDLRLPTPPGTPGMPATQAAPPAPPSPVPAPYLPRGQQTANAPNITPIVPMASGGIVTKPTVALIGEAGPEAVVPLPDYKPLQTPQPVPGLATDFNSPDARASALRKAGWTESAIQTALSVPTTATNQYDPSADSLGLYYPPSQDNATGSINLLGGNIIKDFGSVNRTNTPSTPSDVYEHEAQHAMYALNPVLASGQYNHGQDAATVLADLNTLRQYAAVQHNTTLYDAANQAMAATHDDPEHVNQYLLYAAGMRGAPDWYLNKYFNFLQSSPPWTGAQAQSAQLPADSSRLQGQAAPPPQPAPTQEAQDWLDQYRRGR